MPYAASGLSSRNGLPGSSSASIRSRASILPRSVCLVRADSDPPWATRAVRSRSCSTSPAIPAVMPVMLAIINMHRHGKPGTARDTAPKTTGRRVGERRGNDRNTGPEIGAHTMSKTIPLADRIGAGCGAAYVLLILVGNQLSSGSSTDPHPSGAKDLAELAATRTAAQTVGFGLEMLGFLTFVPFLAWLVHSLRQRGGPAPWLAGAAGGFGLLLLAVKMSSAMPIMAGRLDHAELSPTMARVLTDMNGAAFVFTFVPFGMFLALTGAAFLATGFLGRVAGWSGVVIGGLSVLVTFVSQGDPVNTNPLPFLLGLLWLLVIGIRLAWRGERVPVTGSVESS